MQFNSLFFTVFIHNSDYDCLHALKLPAFLSGSHFFSDQVDLATKNGTTLIFVRPPYPPGDMELRENIYYMRADSVFRSVCDSIGVRYWDFGSPQSETHWNFSDRIHLSEQGSLLFTEKLFEKLRQVDLLSTEKVVNR